MNEKTTVDDILEACVYARAHWYSAPVLSAAEVDLLEAEIRALRTELAMSRPLFSRRQLQAKLARGKALSAKWRQDENSSTEGWESVHTGNTCANELEEALKD